MTKLKFLTYYLLIFAACMAVVIWLYPQTYIYGGLSAPLTRSDVEKQSYRFMEEQRLSTDGFHANPVIIFNRPLIRQTMRELGLPKANHTLRDSLPGFVWSTWWTENTPSTDLSGEPAEVTAVRRMQLEFDMRGNLLTFKHDVPDTARLPAISRADARQVAIGFLNRHTDAAKHFLAGNGAISAIGDTLDAISGAAVPLRRSSDTGGPSRHDFAWTAGAPAPFESVNLTISVAGTQVNQFEIEYPVKPRYLVEGSERLSRFFFPLLLFIIIISTIIIAFRRWQAYEMEFGFSIWFGVVTGLFFLPFFFYQVERPEGLQVYIVMVINALFTGGSAIFVWAVGESLGREVWKEKFITLDLLRNRHFLHSRIGRNIIRGLSFGALSMACMLSLTAVAGAFTPISFVSSADGAFLPHSSGYPLIRMFSTMGFSLLWLLAAYIIFGLSALRSLFRSPILLIATASIIITLAHHEGLEPFWIGTLIEASSTALILTAVYRYNFLAGFVALMTTEFSKIGLGLLHSGNATLLISGYILIGLFAGVLIVAVISLYTHDRVSDYARLAPAFSKNITERERLKKELEIARTVQMDFLPKINPQISMLDIASRCKPALEVGGDYYDFVELGHNRVGVVIGDVSGKGTQAAFYMTLTKGFLRALANMSDSPAFVLTQLNRLFYDNVKRGVFISMIYSVFDMNNGTVTLARAGHNPVAMRKTGRSGVENIHPRGLALGMEKGRIFEQTIQEVQIQFNPGDIFVLYTDGFTEAMNIRREEFGEDRFETIIDRLSDHSAAEIMSGVFRGVEQFAGRAEQHDDMTIVVVKITESNANLSRRELLKLSETP